jgi:F420H(2)-dependent quinone reductase
MMADEGKKQEWVTPAWVPGHIEKYLADPEAAHLWDASPAGVNAMLPTLLLTTTGRKSGEPRHSPILYGDIDGKLVVIASKGGWPDHPAWYLNLQAHPDAEVRVASRRMNVRARHVEGDERRRLYDAMTVNYPPFADYERWASRKGREIPVIVLEPQP